MPSYDLYLPRRTLLSQQVVRREPLHPFAAAFGQMAQWIERVRQRHALAGLDDRQLRDIGITRVDAAREWEKPFWR